MAEKNSEMLTELAQHEEAIGKLYKAYAEVIPTLNEFWSNLSMEENKHATWIRQLGIQAEKAPLFIKGDRFNIAAINTNLDYLRREMDKTNEQSITAIEALSIAFYLEQSLIENKLFEVFETDSVELKDLLQKLNNETINHRIKVKDVLDKQRSTL